MDQQLVCAWCLQVMREGTTPASHGICERCSNEHFPETPTFSEEDQPTMIYLIWSFEHRQWWAPNRAGYVSIVEQAGRYTPDDVAEILANDIMREEIPVAEADADNNKWPATSRHGDPADKQEIMDRVANHIDSNNPLALTRKCEHGIPLNEICRKCDPTVYMVPRSLDSDETCIACGARFGSHFANCADAPRDLNSDLREDR